MPSKKGYQLIDLVPEELKSPELTAKWEMRLTKIAQGSEKKENFIADIKKSAVHLTNMIKADTREYKAHNLTRTKCPVCGKFLLLENSKRGKILKCSDRKCGHVQDERESDPYDFRKSKRQKKSNEILINRFSDNKNKSDGPTL